MKTKHSQPNRHLLDGDPTLKEPARLGRKRLSEAQQEVLAKVRQRIRDSAERRRKAQVKAATIALRFDPETKLKAMRACLKVEGVDLMSILRAHVRSYAEMPEGAGENPTYLRRVQPRPRSSPFLPQDEFWGAMVAEYVQQRLEPGGEITLGELFATLEAPTETRDRSAEMCLGRILRALRFTKRRTWRDGRQQAFYVKPFDFVMPDAEPEEEVPARAPAAPLVEAVVASREWAPELRMTRTGEPMFEANGKTISAAGRVEIALRQEEAMRGFKYASAARGQALDDE